MSKQDKIFDLIKLEKTRQRDTLMMIPSENYTYKEVHQAVGSCLMHKYAEGDPGRRYYQGNEFVDRVESLCEKRALSAFDLPEEEWHANVQPHSGCEANLAVYNAILTPGDKIMSMFLPDGGHLSHGWHMDDNKITLVSKIFNVVFYHVEDKTKTFNYSKLALEVAKERPKLLISGGTAYPREIDHKRMATMAHRVGALYLADIAHEAGLVAAGAQNSPFPYADFVTFTTHKTLRGPRGAVIIARKEYANQIDRSIIPGLQGGPHLHTIAGIAIALKKTKTSKFRKYAQQVVENAKFLAQVLKAYGFDVVTGGTDKHLVLIDLRNKNTNGWFVAWALEKAGIIANRNTVPGDTGSPFYPSGLRLGTPALTARGMKEREMKRVADWIAQAVEISGEHSMPQDKDERALYLRNYLKEINANKDLAQIASEVKSLCAKFPLDF